MRKYKVRYTRVGCIGLFLILSASPRTFWESSKEREKKEWKKMTKLTHNLTNVLLHGKSRKQIEKIAYLTEKKSFAFSPFIFYRTESFFLHTLSLYQVPLFLSRFLYIHRFSSTIAVVRKCVIRH